MSPPRPTRPPTAAFIALLALLTGLGQFGNNVFLPGLPALADRFGLTIEQATLSYSVYLAVFGLGQLAAGPITDRFGRRRLGGLAAIVFALGSLMAATATSFQALLLGRILQASGAAATLVISRAVARDLYEGEALRRVLATVMIVFALVPGFSPLIGGALTQFAGWRAALLFSALVGLGGGIWTLVRLPADGPGISHRSSSSLRVYARLLADPNFLAPVLLCAAAIASISAFFGVSPALFLRGLGISPLEYGLYTPLVVAGFVIGSLAVRRFGVGRSDATVIGWGLAVQVLGCALLILPPALGHLGLGQMIAAMLVFVTGLGIVHPSASAAAMSARPDHAGHAAALLGFAQMSLGALGTLLGSVLFARWPELGMQLAMASFTIAALVLAATTASRSSRSGRSTPDRRAP
ncbi:MAG: MFS transporter [Burkholderiaceae bacterium]|nr:MFS transporter [Burkholderiaceae bacterium]